MKLSRLLGLPTAALLVLGVVQAGPALAAAPANDTVDGAIPVSVGYTNTQNTTDATTDAVDAQLNETCGAPATDASVWYLLQPTTDVTTIIDVSRSNYPAGVAVGVGTPGSLTTVACGPGTILLSATAGETYYVLAFDDQSDGGGNGGQLKIGFQETKTPAVELSVSRKGFVDGDGNAVVRGTFTCTDGNVLEISGSASQAQGPRGATGQFRSVQIGKCDGTQRAWQAVADPGPSNFRVGNALITSFGFVCGPFLCSDGFQQRVIKLRPQS